MPTKLRFPGGFMPRFETALTAREGVDVTAATVRRAYDAGEAAKVQSGRVISLILTFEETGAELDVVLDYIDSIATDVAESARAARSGFHFERERDQHNVENTQYAAAVAVQQRIARLRKELADA